MNINSQHHNLLGSQISPKSEDFCIWRPFCILVTMAMAAILNFFSTPQNLPHTTVDIPVNFHEVWWKESKFFLNPPFFCFHGNCGKVCPTDSDLFWLISFHYMWMLFLSSVINFCLASNLLWSFLCFSIFSNMAISMATAAIFKIPKVICTSTQCLTFLWSFIDFRSVVVEKCVG